MNKRKLLTALATFSPLMLCAAAAVAATSGLLVDPTIPTFTNFISTDVAYGLVGAGFAGIATHCVTGRDFGFYHAALGGCSGRRRTWQSGLPAAPVLGLAAGALSQLVR